MTVEIRFATYADAEQIASTFTEEFYNKTIFKQHVDYDFTTCYRLAVTMVDYHLMIVAVDGKKIVGVIGGLKNPFIFNSNVWSACEVLWFIKPEYRKGSLAVRLLQMYEEELKKQGVLFSTMCYFENLESQTLAKLYERRGYTLTENAYMKTLN